MVICCRWQTISFSKTKHLFVFSCSLPVFSDVRANLTVSETGAACLDTVGSTAIDARHIKFNNK